MGDVSPSVVSGSFIDLIIVVLVLLLGLLMPLVLSVQGYRKMNKYRKSALGLNIFTLLYLLVPLGALLAFIF